MPLLKSCLICKRPCQGYRCADHQPQRPTGRYGAGYAPARAGLRARVASALARGELVTCCICHRPITTLADFTAEHVRPVRDGGGHAGNLAPAHARCNYSAGGQAGGRANGSKRAGEQR